MRRPLDQRPGRSLLISDFAGHAFTYELADALCCRGFDVQYGYCATNVSPKAGFSRSVKPIGIGHGWSFDKYRPVRRIVSEIRYGLGLARCVWRVRPTDHVVCNMPLISGTVAWFLTVPLRTRNSVWFQDVQSGLAGASKGRVGRILSGLESFYVRRADRVIAISQELVDEVIRRGVRPERVGLLENWAPVERIPRYEAGAIRELAGHPVARPLFVYSGTLARKHDPSLLLDLAREATSLGGQVVVISEGEGAECLLREQAVRDGVVDLRIVPYQPFAHLAEALGAADVLVAILDPRAGRYSVPSKTLTYLCAGRPILASMPLENSAADLVARRACAGRVSAPHDRDAFLADARALGRDAATRDRLGQAGRRFAEQTFSEDAVVRNFLVQFGLA